MRVVRALLLAMALLASAGAWADGFGLYATSFDQRALAGLFGGKPRDAAQLDIVVQRFRAGYLEEWDPEEFESRLPVLRSMLREGWHARGPSVYAWVDERRVQEFNVFENLLEMPRQFPEFAAESAESTIDGEMLSPDAIDELLDQVEKPQSSPLRFLGTDSFGRDTGAAEPIARCPVPGTHGYIAQHDCSPVYVILAAAEVRQLDIELRALLGDASARVAKFAVEERYRAGDADRLAAIVAKAARRGHALFFAGFD